MPPLLALDVPLGLVGVGGLFIFAAWLLLAEYRNVFLDDPLSLMSMEVLAGIVGPSGPGYLAAILLVVGSVMLASGLLLTLGLLGFYILAVTGLANA
jgi:hypothetical protein